MAAEDRPFPAISAEILQSIAEIPQMFAFFLQSSAENLQSVEEFPQTIASGDQTFPVIPQSFGV